MTPLGAAKSHMLAAAIGSLAYAVTASAWFLFGCELKYYVSCTAELSDLPLVLLILGGAGLVTHTVTTIAALSFGGVDRLRLPSIVVLYAVAAFLLLWLWTALTGLGPIEDHVQFAITLVPFLGSGAALGLVAWVFLARDSNSTPNADTRDVPAPAKAIGARAGERGG